MKKMHKILLFLLLLYVTLSFFLADQLYYGDETVFVIPAQEIASGQSTGHMIYIDGKFIQDRSSMLMHPPLYIYLLSLFIFLFGKNQYAIRFVSLIFSIGVIILIYLITNNLLKKRNVENSELLGLLASFIYVINPMAIQNSILIDIDGGPLNFFVLLFVYFYISNKNQFYLFISLFLMFWSKLTAPIILFTSLIILNLISKDFKEIWKTIKLFFITGISFFLSFFIYAKIFNLNWEYLFSHNSIFKTLLVFFQEPYKTTALSLWGFKIFFYFATPFLIFLFFILSYIIIKRIINYKLEYLKENKDILLLWIFSWMTIFFFFIVSMTGWNFAKYHITILPLIIILIIYFTPKKIKNIKKIIPILITTLLLLIVFFVIFVKDPLIPEVDTRFSISSFSEIVKPVLARFALYAIAPIVLCFGLFVKIPKKKLWIILLFLVIFTSIYLDVIQQNADYSTHYMYGDKGLQQVLDFMKNKPASEVLCYPNVGYYLGYNETYEITSLYYNQEKLFEVINKQGINWIILYQKDIDLIGKENLENFEIEKEIGGYKILKRKQ